MDIYIVLDIITIAILVIGFIIGIKRGFVRSILGFLSSIASAVAASFVSGWLAEIIYNTFFKNNAVNMFSSLISNDGMMAKIAGGGPIYNYVVNNLHMSGYDDNAIMSILNNVNSAPQALESAIAPIFIALIQGILFVVLFIVFMVLFHFLLKAMRLITHLPIIHQFDQLFGGLLGLIEAVVILFVLILVFGLISLCTSGGTGIISTQNIESSYIFKYFYYLNPIYYIMSIF